MSEVIRYNCGWIHKRKLEKRRGKLQNANAAKRKKKEAREAREAQTRSENPIPSAKKKLGTAIVNLDLFGKKHWCSNCNACLSTTQTINEKRVGLHRVLHIVCMKCRHISEVPLGRTHTGENGEERSDFNSSIVIGMHENGLLFKYQQSLLKTL